MQLPTDIEEALQDVIRTRANARCLIAFPETMTLAPSLLELASTTLALSSEENTAPAPPDSPGPFDLAVVIDAPTVLDRAATRRLLARLRNVDARAVLAAFAREAGDSAWQRSDFLGLGFRQLPMAGSLASNYWLYRYDIHDYKLTPDWLGPRHWANPGQWQKQRW